MAEPLIDYQRFLTVVDFGDPGAAIRILSGELPYEWADAYKKMSPHPANILRIKRDGFEYLFDFSSEFVSMGDVAKDSAVEDRIVAVHGCSQANNERRRDSLMRQHPLGPVEFIRAHSDNRYTTQAIYDKGHFIGHALGGLPYHKSLSSV